jgi:hypothetical protein
MSLSKFQTISVSYEGSRQSRIDLHRFVFESTVSYYVLDHHEASMKPGL